MWILGSWGQSDHWNRASGVQMTKGEDGLYTGVLTLPKGTRFDIKILKSTVSTTSGGNNVWSASRYSSVLNTSASHDFGEFTDNLIPNGNFEGGEARWVPSDCIIEREYAHEGGHFLAVGDQYSNSVTSDTFVIPPNQDLRYSTYIQTWTANRLAKVMIKDVDTHSVLFEAPIRPQSTNQWIAFSGTFKTGGSPVTAQVVCTSVDKVCFIFDAMSLISP